MTQQHAHLDDMSDDGRLGYRPQLNQVIGQFANFSVAFRSGAERHPRG